MYDNPWVLQTGEPVEEIPDEFIAFVYLITNKLDGKKYIGKKMVVFTRRKKVKGKKKKIKTVKESDWRTYWGSNGELIADVIKYGEENFSRVILNFCRSKGEASYYEAKEQFDKNVLLSDEYYNSWISVKIRRSHLNVVKSS